MRRGFHRFLSHSLQLLVDCRSVREDEKSKGYERLEHPEGEAQVDFGVMEAVHEGENVDVNALIVSFSAINMVFIVHLPSEYQECFLSELN